MDASRLVDVHHGLDRYSALTRLRCPLTRFFGLAIATVASLISFVCLVMLVNIRAQLTDWPKECYIHLVSCAHINVPSSVIVMHSWN